MKSYYLLIYLLLLTISSCTSKKQKAPENLQAKPAEYSFSIPEIPLIISKPEHKTAFLAEHYWDNFDFTDSIDLELKKVIEEGFVEYLMILSEVDAVKAAKGISSLMNKAADNRKLSMYYAESAEKFLHHPNSPIRNEILYEEFLKGILACKKIEALSKVRFQHQFDLAQKNKPRTKATDFDYSLKNGSLSSLYKTHGKYLMLYFHNPDCHECEATKDRIVNSSIIQALSEKRELTILAIYPDKDLALWNKHYDEFPDNWINAFDKETIIQDQELYDLKAIPTIYLLDSNKTVLLRDPTFEQLEEYFNRQ